MIVVNNGHLLPIVSISSTDVPTSLQLNNLLGFQSLIKNLNYIYSLVYHRQQWLYGICPSTSFVKDLVAQREGLPSAVALEPCTYCSSSLSIWHQCLGHLIHEVFSKLAQSIAIPCNKSAMILCAMIVILVITLIYLVVSHNIEQLTIFS
jgi:hypothetical protein